MFHLQLRRFPNSARAFNLSGEELERRYLEPWRRGMLVELGERRFDPAKAEISIVEGRELRPDEMAQGRGWSNALRIGEEVSERLLAGGDPAASAAPPSPGAVSPDAFKMAILGQCGGGPIGLHRVVWLAGVRFPQARVSERLALCEQSVWELLHEGDLRLLGADGRLPREGWEPALLLWSAWAEQMAPPVQIERT